MRKIRNPLHAAILSYGANKLAREIGVSSVTVARWCRLGHLPAKYLTTLANLLDLELNQVIEFAVRDDKPIKDEYDVETVLKPSNTLDTLIAVKDGNLTQHEAARQLGISDHSLKLTLVRNEHRLVLLREVLTGWAADKIGRQQACKMLGVTSSELTYLCNTYGISKAKPKREPVVPGRYTENRPKFMEAALDVIRGRENARQISMKRDLPLRTLHRYVKDFIEPMGLNEISHWPTSFRIAYADDLANERKSVVKKWLKVLEDNGIELKKTVKYPKPVENWREATIQRMLVAILLGELNIVELAQARRGSEDALKRLFDGLLKTFGLNYSSVMSQGVLHQAAVADMLILISENNKKVENPDDVQRRRGGTKPPKVREAS